MKIPTYYVHQMIPFHCKRGSKGCQKCLAMKNDGVKWCVLRLFPSHSISEDNYPVARPMLDLEIDGSKFMIEFEFVECFGTELEALKHQQQIAD